MAVDPEKLKKQAEITRLMSSVNVHRMRGELIEAEDACQKALELDQMCVSAREVLADMLHARGQLDKAAEEYRKITEALPGHKSAETKYAKVMLEIGENTYERRVASEMLENPQKFNTPQHPLGAALLSALVPGAGQIYNREIVKGAILAATFLFSMLVLAVSPDTKNIFTNLKAALVPTNVPPPPIGFFVCLFGFILVFVYVYAVIDAPIAVEKAKKKLAAPAIAPPKLEPPTPPEEPKADDPVPSPVVGSPKDRESGNEEPLPKEEPEER